MFSFLADILICFFAAIGLTFSVIGFFDILTVKKTGLSVDIRVNNVKDPDTCEYDLLILQSLINHSPLHSITRQVVISKNVAKDAPERLFYQHKHFRKEE
ncbi:MAG: hypothetical protein E7656_06885 [Ruminococcaceae bacterium]|nr:hypothetical protein [Oscillospiraceae bacterium]